MATAKSVIDVILGEAKGKSYQDMLHIASVIVNRSRDLRESLENVVQNKNEFNAYGKPLPPGVGKYRSLAEKALAEVKTKGPVTPAQFYATPSAVKNLPKGLKKVTSTDGHDYFVDPQKRAIGTAVGYKKPQGIQTAQLTGPASASARGSANLGYTDTYTGVDSLHPAMQARASAFLDDAKRQGQRLYNNAPLFAGDIPIPTPRQPKPIQTAQLTGKAAASAEGSANLGKKGNGLGLMNLAPSMVKDGTVKTAMADTRMDPRMGDVVSSLVRGGFGNEAALSGYRTEAENRAVGGARLSQHLFGKALDIRTREMPFDKKADMLDRALMSGARGVGLYTGPKQGVHVDVRNNPQFWSGNYHGLTAEQAPSWAKDQIGQLLSLDKENVYLPTRAANIPIPTPRQPMALMAQAKAADRQFADRSYNPGGIVDAKAISLNLVPSANAGEMPKITRSALPAIQDRIRPMPTSAPAKTSTGVGYSLPKAQPTTPIAAKSSGPQTLYNRSGGATNDFRPMPTGTIPQRVSAPVQSTPAPRYNPLPSGPVAPSVSPQTMAAAYGQYAQTRMAAPSTPMQANPAAAPFTVKATAGQMTTQPIVGPLSNAPIQAPVAATTGQFKKFTPIQKIQQKLKTAVEPENLKAMGGQLAGGAAGSLLGGPIGGILGGLIGKQIMSQPQGQGLLAGLFGGGNNGYQGQSTYIGNGVNAVDRAMYGNRAGDTATYNSQGGGTVTNLGNGSSQRTSSKYGWTETTHADGSKSIKYK